MKKYGAGFAGAGHMGKILAKAAVKAGVPVAVACSTSEHSKRAAEELNCAASVDGELIYESRYLFLGMKPQNLPEFVSENEKEIREAECVFVSMLAGIPLARLMEALGKEKKIIRIMPNTPCSVGKGLIFAAADGNVSDEEKKELERILSSCGSISWIPEQDMDAVSVVAGCGPAYFYAFADAVAKAGEKLGLSGEAALRYAALVMAGSAEMILKTGKTAEELKREVCSPGGTTIEGVKVLTEKNLDGITEEALQASFRKTKGMR